MELYGRGLVYIYILYVYIYLKDKIIYLKYGKMHKKAEISQKLAQMYHASNNYS